MAGSPTNLSKSKVSFHSRILFADLIYVGQDPYFSYPKQPGMFTPDPDYPDPGSNKNKKRRGKKFVVSPFLVTINFTKSNFFVFLTGTATFQRIKVLFTQKNCC
jgi:hypothetical protein